MHCLKPIGCTIRHKCNAVNYNPFNRLVETFFVQIYQYVPTSDYSLKTIMH